MSASTVVVKGATDPISLGMKLLGGEVSAAACGNLVEQRNDLLDALYLALPFVEDHEGGELYKPGAVAKALSTIRVAIAKAEAAP